jgi:hypothetical protein
MFANGFGANVSMIVGSSSLYTCGEIEHLCGGEGGESLLVWCMDADAGALGYEREGRNRKGGESELKDKSELKDMGGFCMSFKAVPWVVGKVMKLDGVE